MLKIIQHFGKYFICHLRRKYLNIAALQLPCSWQILTYVNMDSEDDNCIVCRNVWSFLTFDAAHARKPTPHVHRKIVRDFSVNLSFQNFAAYRMVARFLATVCDWNDVAKRMVIMMMKTRMRTKKTRRWQCGSTAVGRMTRIFDLMFCLPVTTSPISATFKLLIWTQVNAALLCTAFPGLFKESL
jgi:hypothetical protein